MQPYEGDPTDLFCRFLSLEFNFSTHSLDDDGECDFTRFRYQLGTRTPWADADIRGVQIGVMAVLPSVLFQRARISTGILVYDTQRLRVRYRAHENELFDEVGGGIVTQPKHIADLNLRIT